MKKVFSFLLSLMMIIYLTACSGRVTVEPMLDFNARASVFENISDNELSVEAELVNNSEGYTLISVSSPDELCDLSFKWSDCPEISYHGLTARVQSGYLPRSSFASAIKDILTDLRGKSVEINSSDEYAVFDGVIGTASYRVNTDAVGRIQSMCVEEYGLDVRFSYQVPTD